MPIRSGFACPLLQRRTEGRDSLLKTLRPALPLPEHPVRETEIVDSALWRHNAISDKVPRTQRKIELRPGETIDAPVANCCVRSCTHGTAGHIDRDAAPCGRPARGPGALPGAVHGGLAIRVVAAEQPIAARAGTAILEAGGNAIDAAVAANAAMGLTAPMMDGIGGDLFAMVYDAKTKKIYGLNASGWAPKGLTPEFLKSKGLQWMPTSGIHSVTVPGAVAGWDALLSRFGRKGFAEVLAPAIAVAKTGFPVTEIFADEWDATAGYLQRNPEAARVFLPSGRAPEVGEIFRNRDLARALEDIARDGRDAFYKGPVARRILDTSAKFGGTLAADDLAEFAPSGSSRFRPITAAGRSTKCRPTSRASRR